MPWNDVTRHFSGWRTTLRNRNRFITGLLLLWGLLLMAGCLEDDAQPGAETKGKAETEKSAKVAAGEPAQIECKESTHDVGNVNQGDSMVHTFAVKNTGKGPLHINEVKSS